MASAFLRRFVQEGGHELRTPLTVLLSELESATAESLPSLLAKTKNLVVVINRWLYLADAEWMRETSAGSELRIASLMQSLCAAFRTLYEGKLESFVVVSAGSTDFFGNEALLVAILGGLLEDAIHSARRRVCVQYSVNNHELSATFESDGGELSLRKELALTAVRACVDTARGRLHIAEVMEGGRRLSIRVPESDR